MKLTLVAGARPNFVKIAPIIDQINKQIEKDMMIEYDLVHTGQHYDKKMSKDFFDELNIPNPTVNLECGGGSQAEMTAKIMVSFEKFLKKNKSNLVLLFGDVNSTMACAIVARKLGIDVGHVEAGIRSFDWNMPEEINRIVTDSLSNYFFTTSQTANDNLIKSGFDINNIFYVGNVMIDTLLHNISRLVKPEIWKSLNLKKSKYLVVTLHRPSNVDEENNFKLILETIIKYTDDVKLVYPAHPRTKNILKKLKINYNNLKIIEPLSYLRFNYLVKNSLGVITDSGGITEETTVLGVPCITIRENTERPETVQIGTNELVGTNPYLIKKYLKKLVNNKWKKGKIPQYWDGNTSKRIIEILNRIYG